jgi:hypothetical protein
MNVNSDKSGNSSSHDDDGLSSNAQKGNSDSNDDVISNELNDMSIGSSSSKKKKNTCLCCLKEVDGLLGCSRCLTARYCGKDCQVKHWPVHRNSCRDSNDTEDSNEKLAVKARNHTQQGSLMDR